MLHFGIYDPKWNVELCVLYYEYFFHKQKSKTKLLKISNNLSKSLVRFIHPYEYMFLTNRRIFSTSISFDMVFIYPRGLYSVLYDILQHTS